MSHPTKPVVKHSFLLPATSYLELAKKTEDYLLFNPKAILLSKYKYGYVEKEVYNRLYRNNLWGYEKHPVWYVKVGIIE